MNKLFNFNWSLNKTHKLNSLKANVHLPPCLHHLLEYYETGSNSFRRQYLRKGDDLILLTCHKYKRGAYENFISGLLDLDQIEIESRCFIQTTDNYHREGLFKIGYFDLDDLLLISLNHESCGLVSILNVDPFGLKEGDRIINLGVNLMVFLEDLKEELILQNLSTEAIHANDLYRKWDDDLWKV